MKITFIRHGQSVANIGHYISDDPLKPVGLTEIGKAQAESLAAELNAAHFTHAFASEFPRAQETALILLKHHSCTLNIDARLNERKSGMDGQPVHLFNEPLQKNPLHYKTEHGETFLEQMSRVKSFLDDLYLNHPEGSILAVSHENPIVAALALTVADPASVVLSSINNCGRLDLTWPVQIDS
jgi:broad specificity phosphatase PhoE